MSDKRKPALTFFHPDFTVGPGVSPDHREGKAVASA